MNFSIFSQANKKACENIYLLTDYVGNLIYENGTLMKILYDGGYYEPSTNRYYYFVNDYLGGMRTVLYGTNGNIHEKGQYYPFGSVMAQETSYEDVQPYKFSGKEEDHERGLNWYDFHARQYESALGRFTSMDPMAEKYYSVSPYAYCNNNPVVNIDPDGKNWYRYKQDDHEDDDWIYAWDDEIYDQKALDKKVKGAEYLGKMYDDGTTYFSLFGSRVESGSTEGKFYKMMDRAIHKMAERKIEAIGQSGADVSKTEYTLSGPIIAPRYSRSGPPTFELHYEGSSHAAYRIYTGPGMMKGHIEDWIGDNGMPKSITGYFQSNNKKYYHIRAINRERMDIVHLQYNQREANILLNKYYNLYPALKTLNK